MTDRAPLGRAVSVGRLLSIGLVAIATLAAYGYTVVLGGTSRGELDGVLRLINGVLAGGFVLLYGLRAPAEADRVDRGILLALLLFLAACLTSLFPRQSLDAAFGVLVATAFFFVARGELSHPPVRTAFIRLVMYLSVGMTLVTAALWLPVFFGWWSLTNWQVIPPLDLSVQSFPWGHRHDLAMLVLMLYPSLWIGRLSPLRFAVAIVLGFFVLLIVVVDGSRNLWLAVIGATVVVAAVPAYDLLRKSRHAAWSLLVSVVVVIAVALATGVAGAVVDRLANVESVGWRGAMWGPLLGAWAERPVSGYGPGSFPWILQLTDYFVTSSWAPRHPDSAVVQLLAEGGILGFAAGLTVLLSLLVPLMRSRSRAARWAVFVFVLGSVGANPTDFAFLIVVAAGWTAYAVPREPRPARVVGRTSALIRGAWVVGVLVIGIAYATTSIAGIAYEEARRQVASGALDDGRRSLEFAVALDPSMALYRRERGTLAYIEGDHARAIADLEHATRLNPSDDQAWRALALAFSAAQDQDAADVALGHALATQRSDRANLLLAALWQTEQGQSAEALATLAEVVQAWPAIVGAPGWQEVLPVDVSTNDVIDAAIARWETGQLSPEPFIGQGLWLAAMGSRPDLLSKASDASEGTPALARAAFAVLVCDPTSDRDLGSLTGGDRRLRVFWSLLIRASAQNGLVDRDALMALGIMRGSPIDAALATAYLSPLQETGFSSDVWGYRRLPEVWPARPDHLPSLEAAEIRWLLEPGEAIGTAGLEERLPACARSGL